jgi:ATP-dependent Clp protease, protease subunit
MAKSADDILKKIWIIEFNSESVKEFYEQFNEWETSHLTDTIPVYVNSYGGQVHALIAMRDLIKTSIKPVSTICVGKAMSCGASLLAAGEKGMRFASPDSRILIHQVSSMTLGKASDIKADAAQIHDLNEMMLRNLAEDTGNSVQKIKKEIKGRDNTDWTLTAEEALKWGIIDGIGIPRNIWPEYKTSLQVFADEKSMQKMGIDPKRVKPKRRK